MAASNLNSPTMGDRSKTSSPATTRGPTINNPSGTLSSLLLSAFSHQTIFAPNLRVAGLLHRRFRHCAYCRHCRIEFTNITYRQTKGPKRAKGYQRGYFNSHSPSPLRVSYYFMLTTSSEKQVPSIKQPDSDESKEGLTTNAPLAPPPKPTQNGGDNDYFSSGNKPTHFSSEPNPFENAFGSNPADTPGKPQLPGVTSLTSPASLLPSATPGWPGSLRSGPLSPAMLTGPTSNNDYFSGDHHFSGSFPTPNESSLRTGLTPGGGGSMFPQPSPNSQALYNSLQSGGATPGTLDFHRTAMTARAHSQANNNFNMPASTSQAQQNPNIQPDLDSKPYNPNGQSQQPEAQDPFSSHQTNDAANGLFMLAQASTLR